MLFILKQKFNLILDWNLIENYKKLIVWDWISLKKVWISAGIEPETPAWQLAALTTRPPGHWFSKNVNLLISKM